MSIKGAGEHQVLSPNKATSIKLVRIFFFAWLAISIGGFGIMLLLWQFSDWPYEQGGFFFYKAAIWGDGVFLPTLIASMLCYLVSRQHENSKVNTIGQAIWKERRFVIIGIIFSMIGVYMQLSWVMSDATTLNWTIPELHHFNFAGLFHAFYFILMFGLIAYFFARVTALRVSSVKRENSPATTVLYTLIWFGGAGYTFLHFFDDRGFSFANTQASIILLGFLLFAFLLYTITTARFQLNTNDLRAVISGVLLAFGVCVFICNESIAGNTSLIWFVIAFSILSASLCLPTSKGIRAAVLPLLFLVLCGFGLGALLAISLSESSHQTILALVPAVAFLFFVSYSKINKDKLDLYLLALLFIVSCVGSFSNWVILPDSFLGVITIVIDWLWLIPLFLGIIYGRFLWKYFAKIPSVTLSVNATDSMAIKRAMFLPLYSIVLGLVFFVMAAITVDTNESQILLGYPALWLLAIASLFIALLFLAKTKAKTTKVIAVASVLLILLYSVLTIFIVIIRQPVFLGGLQILLAFPIFGSSLFIANGIFGNTRKLLGGEVDFATWIIIAIVLMGSIMVFAVSVLPSKTVGLELEPGLFSPLVGVLGCITGGIIFPMVASCFTKYSPPDGQPIVLPDTGLDGMHQDSLMGLLMIVGIGLLFQLLLQLLLPYQYITNNLELIPVIFYSVINLLFALGITTFALKNNSDHLKAKLDKEFRKEIVANPSNSEAIEYQLVSLLNHLEWQSRFVFLSMLPIAMPIVVAYDYFKGFNESSEKSFDSFLYKEYLFELNWRKRKYGRIKQEECIKELGLIK